MSDHELLKLAAKAEGSVVVDNGEFWIETSKGWKYWMPLTDDGDALRLAVKLMMDISISKHNCFAVAIDSRSSGKLEHAKKDLAAATRRAIVHAAAEIGKAMA